MSVFLLIVLQTYNKKTTPPNLFKKKGGYFYPPNQNIPKWKKSVV